MFSDTNQVSLTCRIFAANTYICWDLHDDDAAYIFIGWDLHDDDAAYIFSGWDLHDGDAAYFFIWVLPATSFIAASVDTTGPNGGPNGVAVTTVADAENGS